MLKITKYSIPVVLAGLVLTGRTQETTTATQQPAGAPGTSQSDAYQEQQERQRDLQQQQRERQQQAQQEQQRLATEQQKSRQSTFQPDAVSEQQLKTQVTAVNKASSFIGMAVKNTNNEDLGKINDLVFDPEKGKISYAVLSYGGLLGVGDKLVAVPITSIKPQPGQNYLVLNMPKSQLESAPGLAQNNWPDLDDPSVGGAAGSQSGSGDASEATNPSSSSSSPTDLDSSSSSSSTTDDASSSHSNGQGGSATTSIGSNSDSQATTATSQSQPGSTDASSTSSDESPTQGETKTSDH